MVVMRASLIRNTPHLGPYSRTIPGAAAGGHGTRMFYMYVHLTRGSTKTDIAYHGRATTIENVVSGVGAWCLAGW